MRLIKKSNYSKCVETAFMMRSDLLVILLVTMFCKVTSDCDASNPKVDGVNLGQTAAFPWLGVLRVYLPGEFGDRPEIAITGIVLIKKNHALVSADDVVKIPEKIFKEHTHAMFLVHTDNPWYCKPKSYKTHHEYEFKTLNTIALIELDLVIGLRMGLRPICWNRRKQFHTSLYLTGYTDEHEILEKTIHKVKYADKQICEDFYWQSQFTEANHTPIHYVCGYTKLKHQCVWENGMVLASNASGHFTLVGFSIRGPGCAAPARFIDLQKYQKWVDDVTTVRAKSEEDYRRVNVADDALGNIVNRYRQRLSFGEFFEGEVPKPWHMEYTRYGFDTEKPRYFNVDELDNNTLRVLRFNETAEAYDKSCSRSTVLLYKEQIDLKTMFKTRGVAYYKISLYDLLFMACGCVKLHIDSSWRSEAVIAYKEFFDIGEGIAAKSSEETPEEIMKYFPVEERTTSTTEGQVWKPSPILTAQFLKDPRRRTRLLHYDLYVRFGFYDHAVVTIEMYAEKMAPTTTTKPSAHRRMFDSPVLTSKEERLEFLKQSRVKMTRPPGRKLWYDDIPKNRTTRSGLVSSIPKAVSNYFDDDSEDMKSSIYNVIVNKIIETSAEVIDDEPLKTYLKFIRNFTKPDENEVPQQGTIKTTIVNTMRKFENNIPDFIINALRSINSPPKKPILPETDEESSLSSVVIARLDNVMCLIVLAFVLHL